MKNFMKGLITGIILTIILCAIPVLAQNGEFLFNDIRINIDGTDRVRWGQDDTLSDGRAIPYSIMYNDTTYLPMRRIAEMNGKQIYWNGDSKTASMTGTQKDGTQAIFAQKADKNGNLWRYYTFETEDGKSYLGIKDESRGYERVYRRANESYVGVTENELCFVRLIPENGIDKECVYKIPFLNDENTQDGEVFNVPDEVAFDGEYIYYNFHMNSFSTTGPTFQGEITFDRNTNTVSDPVHLYEIEI